MNKVDEQLNNLRMMLISRRNNEEAVAIVDSVYKTLNDCVIIPKENILRALIYRTQERVLPNINKRELHFHVQTSCLMPNFYFEDPELLSFVDKDLETNLIKCLESDNLLASCSILGHV